MTWAFIPATHDILLHHVPLNVPRYIYACSAFEEVMKDSLVQRSSDECLGVKDQSGWGLKRTYSAISLESALLSDKILHHSITINLSFVAVINEIFI